MIEEGLFNALKGDTAIDTKVGYAPNEEDEANTKWHIYPLRLPEGVDLSNGYAISYTEISQRLNYPTARQSLIQLNCFGDTFDKARDLANDIDTCLNDLSASKLGGTFPITYIKFENRQALYDDNAKLWYFAVEVSINY